MDVICEQAEFNEKKLLDGSLSCESETMYKEVMGCDVKCEVSVAPRVNPDSHTLNSISLIKFDLDEMKKSILDANIPEGTYRIMWGHESDKNLWYATGTFLSLNAAKGEYNSGGSILNIGGIKLSIDRKPGATNQEVSYAMVMLVDLLHAEAKIGNVKIPYTEMIDKSLKLQVGANAGEQIRIPINRMDSKALGLANIDIATQESALKAIDALDKAIDKVSKTRSSLGAIQNRLEHTIRNLDNTAENLTAAESGIRDTDMAKEITENAKNNIVSEAANAMLTQANNINKNVLALLE